MLPTLSPTRKVTWKLSRFFSLATRLLGLLRLLFVAFAPLAILNLLIFFADLANDLLNMFQSESFKNRDHWTIFSFTIWCCLGTLILSTEAGRFMAFAATFVMISDIMTPVFFLLMSLTSRTREFRNSSRALKSANEDWQRVANDSSKTPAYIFQLDQHIQHLQSKHNRILVKCIFRIGMLFTVTMTVLLCPFFPILIPVLPSILISYSAGMFIYKCAMYLYKDLLQTPPKNAARYAHPDTQEPGPSIGATYTFTHTVHPKPPSLQNGSIPPTTPKRPFTKERRHTS